MKILLLLRHAKSSWKDESLADQDRPLAKRGLRDAPRVGKLLNDANLLPDLILSSTARRARQTVELVTDAAGYTGEVSWLDDLYAAAPEEILELLSALPAYYTTVMVVGHNPGLEELMALLTDQVDSLTTAALAQIDLPLDGWDQLTDETQGKLVNIWRPREL
jgi:phosphohistidine phosphatase